MLIDIYVIVNSVHFGNCSCESNRAKSKRSHHPYSWLSWGRDEVPFRYWGGFKHIEEHLNQQGYQIYIVAVGTFSSNYNRAAELYAYIKGGRVDYRAAHAKEHGHDRYVRTYPGVYPQWGVRSLVEDNFWLRSSANTCCRNCTAVALKR
ncbi:MULTISPECIES: lipase [Bacillus cereus group]|uniref:lipase-like domain-containing protein n=1 Tax=Bacillus cereus group TaxID=86661 RepID=UPI0023EEC47F|nr:hypothetical protein [Bacillus cereus]